MDVSIPRVCHRTVERIFGVSWASYGSTVRAAHQKLAEDNLLVHIIVLVHGSNPSRITSTTAMLDMLSQDVKSDRVHVWLSYQGHKLPAELEKGIKKYGISLLVPSKEKGNLSDYIPQTGKTEHILHALKTIYDQDLLPPKQQFIAFIDNDYLVYDAINVHSLYVPWVMNTRLPDSTVRDHIYVKAGGLRLRLHDSPRTQEWLAFRDTTPVSFYELCHESLRQAKIDPAILNPSRELLPTAPNLTRALGASVMLCLERSLENIAQQGGRSNRGLLCYLQARRSKPLARFLSEFSFLLHGDQGTSLANWMEASLASGYGLELSFLKNTTLHRQSVVINVIGLPHSHHPKEESENFLLGIELFTTLTDILEPDTPVNENEKSWSCLIPGTLAYNKLVVTKPRTHYYPSLHQLMIKGDT